MTYRLCSDGCGNSRARNTLINLSYLGDRAESGLRQNLAQREMHIAGLSGELVRSRAEVKALQELLSERIRLERVLSVPDLRLTRL